MLVNTVSCLYSLLMFVKKKMFSKKAVSFVMMKSLCRDTMLYCQGSQGLLLTKAPVVRARKGNNSVLPHINAREINSQSSGSQCAAPRSFHSAPSQTCGIESPGKL